MKEWMLVQLCSGGQAYLTVQKLLPSIDVQIIKARVGNVF